MHLSTKRTKARRAKFRRTSHVITETTLVFFRVPPQNALLYSSSENHPPEPTLLSGPDLHKTMPPGTKQLSMWSRSTCSIRLRLHAFPVPHRKISRLFEKTIKTGSTDDVSGRLRHTRIITAPGAVGAAPHGRLIYRGEPLLLRMYDSCKNNSFESARALKLPVRIPPRE